MSPSPINYALAFMVAVIIASFATAKSGPLLSVADSIPIFVLAAQVCLIALIIAILLKGRSEFLDFAISSVAKDSRKLAFLIALTAMCGSLFYQFGMQYAPCELCWFQRIFMYPLSFIIGVSIIRDRKDIFEFVIPLCSIGSVIAAYQYSMQLFPIQSSVCSASAVSCSTVQTTALGYITIPLMSLTAFLCIAALLYLDKRFSPR